MDDIRVLEFFAGIGGMKLACSALNVTHTTAFEIAPPAAEVYRHNIRDNCEIKIKLIEQLTLADVDGKAEMWTMSPPCQPFTKTMHALHKGVDDQRNAGFKHLVHLLSLSKQPPKWIIFENVKHFQGSKMEEIWKTCLRDKGFSWQSYLVSPHQIGIPNCRTRFYMICERSSRFVGETTITNLPGFLTEPNRFPLSQYMVPTENSNNLLLLSKEVLDKQWAKELHFVTQDDTLTYCFTSGYSRQLHRSTGSIFLSPSACLPVQSEPATTSERVQKLETPSSLYGHVRKFSPKEILNLFGFPPHYNFPPEIDYRWRWKLVGNSINVTVVSLLVGHLFAPYPHLHKNTNH